MYDYHTHSHFSSDADFSIEDMIIGALNVGLVEIAITDHVDYDYADPSIQFDFDHNIYKNEIAKLQNIYNEKITLRHGLELGLQPHLVDRYKQLVSLQDPDFVLCSLHTCKNLDLYRGDYYLSRTPKEAWEDYLHEVLTVAKTFDAYNVLGHLDILRRYNAPTAEFPIKSLYPFFKELFDIIIPKGKGLEVNTSGYRTAQNMPLPSWDILKWYQDAGGIIITTGSDAHSPDVIAYQFGPTLSKLRDLGFKHICSFKKMNPTFISI